MNNADKPAFAAEAMTDSEKLIIAIDALKNIHQPIKYLQQKCEEEHGSFDGQMGISISNDPWYLKGVAERALNKIT
jgi:hypothetical protein